MKLSILATSTRRPFRQPMKRAEHQHDENGERPGKAVERLQADGENVPEHDAIADGEIDAACRHGDHRRQRQDANDRLVGNDRAQVQQRREGVWQQDREQEDEDDGEDDQAIDRHEPADVSAAGQLLQFAARRLKGIGLDGVHGSGGL